MRRKRIEPVQGQESVWDYPRPPRLHPDPTPPFAGLEDYVAFYPSKMDGRWVGGEKVEAQDGDFYGGWITPEIVGPFKGAPGSWGW